MTTTMTGHPLLRTVIAEASAIDYAEVDETTLAYLRIALLDWIGVTLAGAQEESSRLVRHMIEAEGGEPRATVLGSDRQASARQAALANGVAGHALDYDDMGLGERTRRPSSSPRCSRWPSARTRAASDWPRRYLPGTRPWRW